MSSSTLRTYTSNSSMSIPKPKPNHLDTQRGDHRRKPYGTITDGERKSGRERLGGWSKQTSSTQKQTNMERFVEHSIESKLWWLLVNSIVLSLCEEWLLCHCKELSGAVPNLVCMCCEWVCWMGGCLRKDESGRAREELVAQHSSRNCSSHSPRSIVIAIPAEMSGGNTFSDGKMTSV